MAMMRMSALALALWLVTPNVAETQHPPIIDMHLHAYAADVNGPPPRGLCIPIFQNLRPLDPGRETLSAASARPACSDPIWSPATDDGVMEHTIAVVKRRNIIGILSGAPERVRRWYQAAPDRFIPAIEFQLGPNQISPESLRQLFTNGPFAVLGEVSNQYVGIAPDDPRMEPYWTLAEAMDIPVGIHMGEGPPGVGYLAPAYRARLSSPYLLEEVLSHHPRLRMYVMHYASPLVDEMIAILGSYPQVHIDSGGIQWAYPRPYFYGQLKRLIDAGFENRVMFRSDQMNWPGVIEPAIAIIEEAPFLTEMQRRDIFYNNAA